MDKLKFQEHDQLPNDLLLTSSFYYSVGLIGLVGLLLLLTVSCNRTPAPSPDLAPATLEWIPDGTAQIATGEEALPLVETSRQLVIWAPPFFQATLDLATDGVLTPLYEQFERNHPGVHIDVQIRAESGEASFLNYLRGAQRVAPAILPDIILVNTQQLWQVAELDLLLPLEIEQLETILQFFPSTLPAVTYNEEIVGIPYTANLTHIVYHESALALPPQTWSDLLASDQPYIFSGGRFEELGAFAYLQYLGSGGQVHEDDVVDEEALRALFTYLVALRTEGIVPDSVLEITSADSAWSTFINTKRGLADTSTQVVLNHWEAMNSGGVQYAPIATRNGAPISIAHIWAFAIVASDSEQQALSMSLLNAFMESTIHGEWSRAAMQIPTQAEAFEVWRNSSPYFDFIQTQLKNSITLPGGRRFAELNRRLQDAQELVLRGEMSVDDAVLYVQTTS